MHSRRIGHIYLAENSNSNPLRLHNNENRIIDLHLKIEYDSYLEMQPLDAGGVRKFE